MAVESCSSHTHTHTRNSCRVLVLLDRSRNDAVRSAELQLGQQLGAATPPNVDRRGCSGAVGLMEWLPGPGEILQLPVFLTAALFCRLLFDGGPQRA